METGGSDNPRRSWLWLLGLLGVIYLWGLGRLPLVGYSEGRYAAIAAEMWHSGDWMTPRYSGLLQAVWTYRPDCREVSLNRPDVTILRCPFPLGWKYQGPCIVMHCQRKKRFRRRAKQIGKVIENWPGRDFVPTTWQGTLH